MLLMTDKECLTIVASVIASGVMLYLFLQKWCRLRHLKDDRDFGKYAAGFLALVFAICLVLDLVSLVPNSPIHMPVSVKCGSMLTGLLVYYCYFLSACKLTKLNFGVVVASYIVLVIELLVGPLLDSIDPALLLIILYVEVAATWVLSKTLFKQKLDSE